MTTVKTMLVSGLSLLALLQGAAALAAETRGEGFGARLESAEAGMRGVYTCYAVDAYGSIYYWTGPTLQIARANAIASCQASSGTYCTIDGCEKF